MITGTYEHPGTTDPRSQYYRSCCPYSSHRNSFTVLHLLLCARSQFKKDRVSPPVLHLRKSTTLLSSPLAWLIEGSPRSTRKWKIGWQRQAMQLADYINACVTIDTRRGAQRSSCIGPPLSYEVQSRGTSPPTMLSPPLKIPTGLHSRIKAVKEEAQHYTIEIFSCGPCDCACFSLICFISQERVCSRCEPASFLIFVSWS